MSVDRALRVLAELGMVAGLIIVLYDVAYEWIGMLVLGVSLVVWRNTQG